MIAFAVPAASVHSIVKVQVPSSRFKLALVVLVVEEIVTVDVFVVASFTAVIVQEVIAATSTVFAVEKEFLFDI